MPFIKIVEKEVVTTNFSDFTFAIRKDQDPHAFSDVIDIHLWPNDEDFDRESEAFSPNEEELKCIEKGIQPFVDSHGTFFNIDWGTDYTLGLYFPKRRVDDEFAEKVANGEETLCFDEQEQLFFDSTFEYLRKFLLQAGLVESSESHLQSP